LGLALLPLGAGRAVAQVGGPAVLIVSRKRLLNETVAARDLLDAEIALTAELQRRVDALKAQFTAEEQELARLRPTMEREAFEARVAEFDRNVRRERRQTQHRAAALQNAFRDARLQFVEALGPVLEAVRIARGASIIVNTEGVLAADPAADVTDEVIAQVNATVPTPAIPDLDSLDPGPETPLDEDAPAAGTGTEEPQ
jgi:Skp family chaperone for outer membrane proteins